MIKGYTGKHLARHDGKGRYIISPGAVYLFHGLRGVRPRKDYAMRINVPGNERGKNDIVIVIQDDYYCRGVIKPCPPYDLFIRGISSYVIKPFILHFGF